MSNFGSNPFQQRQPLDYGSQAGSPTLTRFFNAVYGWMACGLAITAIVAWFVAHNQHAMQAVMNGGVFLMIFVAQLVLVFTISAAVRRINSSAATLLFLFYAALNGLTLAGIFLVYAQATIVTAFVASAAMFGVMSIYGMLTQSDLSGVGKVAFMGLIGIIVASIVNIFLANSMLDWVISYAGVGIFAVLTAYDTQRLKQVAYSTASDGALASRLAINGALMLYLDFLNMFLFILRILGNSQR